MFSIQIPYAYDCSCPHVDFDDFSVDVWIFVPKDFTHAGNDFGLLH